MNFEFEIEEIEGIFTVCKLKNISDFDFNKKFFFLGKTDDEISLVCLTSEVPSSIIEKEDNWRAFRIKGVLDFSIIGLLAEVSRILADEGISIFAVSTFNTDYILVKEKDFEKAIRILEK